MGAQRGASLLEVLSAMGLFAVLSGAALANYRALENPALTGASALAAFFKETRAKAMAATLAYTIKPSSNSRIVTTSGKTCAAAQSADAGQTLDLPRGAFLGSVDWSVCYDTRGIADTSVDITVADGEGTHVVQAALGGGVRIRP